MDPLNTSLSGLDRMLPELIVAGTALGVILAEILSPKDRRALITPILVALGLVVSVVLLLFGQVEGLVHLVGTRGGQPVFDHVMWNADGFAHFVRALAAVGGLLAVLLSVPYVRRMDRGHGEFYALLLFALLGVMLVSGVSDLLSLFVCLELVTISSYVLAAFKRNDAKSTEAGLKYLVIGAVSSAILLMGIALVYGAVGDVTFASIAQVVGNAAQAPSLLLITGLVMLVAGILFKVGAVPFHVWIPDVYQGAPSPVVAFLSTGSKLAGMILLLRLAQGVFLPWVEAGHGLLWVWLLGGLAAITLLYGLLSAIPQRNLKRLFGYSSIGHAGYLLMGAAAIAATGWPEGGGAAPGVTAILYYLLAFFFTNLTAFTVIVLVSGATGGRHGAESYSGLWKRAPFLALAMLLALLSLAGVPPLSGFFGKFLVLSAVVQGADTLSGLYVLAFIGAVGVAVSLYFYMRWIREMYFEPPEPMTEDVKIKVGPAALAVLVVGILAMLGMGIFMGPFYAWAEAAARALASL